MSSTSTTNRVVGIDVARGFALLGILLVNAQFFGQPFGKVIQFPVPKDEGWLGQFAFWFTDIFCGGKFYPLFSILFGAGLAMMFESAKLRGSSFEWSYVRRMGLLAGFGITHIIFLWYGDILLMYSLIGISMVWLARFRPKTLVITGLVVFGLGLLLMIPTTTLLTWFSTVNEQELVVKPMPQASSVTEQYLKVFADWNQTESFDSRVIELERTIMSKGPYSATVVVRLVNYASAGTFGMMVMCWVIFPCFCWGAALMKSGFFHGQHRNWRSRLIWIGLSVGLPLSTISAWASRQSENLGLLMLGTTGLMICGPVLALLYLSLILNWSETGKARWLSRWLANAGKMALTCYLLESVLMSAIMMHWGVGRFGDNTWAERFVWAIAIYGMILVFARVWMSRLSQGPFEWIWRRFTYWGQPERLPQSTVVEGTA